MHRSSPEPLYRFEPYEFDLQAHQLRKNDIRVRLAEKSFQALHLLLQNAGAVVPREVLSDHLWGQDTFVDFADSLNHVIKRVRDALLDSADQPRLIETVPGVGYRFIASVQRVPVAVEPADAVSPPAGIDRKWFLIAAIAVFALLFAGMAFRAANTGGQPVPLFKLTQLTRDTGLTFQPSLSNDGVLIAYASDRGEGSNLDIWLNRVGGRNEPNRLTSHEAHDYQPSFSPDGTQIAFRSERGESGIYVIPALGGPERFIAKEGRDPRFSPDGKQIAFWIGGGGQFRPRKLYVVDVAGGEPRQLAADFDYARRPIWSPDGSYLMFVGIHRYLDRDFRGDHPGLRWWVVPADGGSPRETGILAELQRRGIEWRFFVGGRRLSDPRWNAEGPELWLPETNEIVFSAQSGDSVNVWRIPVSATGDVAGAPVRLTSGAGFEVSPVQDAQGRIVFSTFAMNADIWSLPIEPDSGTPSGPLQRLTNDTSINHTPSISADGRKLVYLSNRAGNDDLWVKEIESGKEWPLTTAEHNESRGVISKDGSSVAYASGGRILVLSTQGGSPREIVSDCEATCSVFDVSADGNTILYYRGRPPRYFCLDMSTGKTTEVLKHPESPEDAPHNARFSPDAKWLTFHVLWMSPIRASVFVAPLGEGRHGREDTWLEISADTRLNLTSAWSANGRLLYYISRDGGFTRLLARRLLPETKKPIGPPREVYRFPQSPYALPFNTGQLGLWAGDDQLAFTLQEMTGNIWMVE